MRSAAAGPGDRPDVHAHAVIGEAHEVFHRRGGEFAAWGQHVTPLFEIRVHQLPVGVVGLPIQIRDLVLHLLQDREIPRRRGEARDATGHVGPAHHFILVVKGGALGVHIDHHLGDRLVTARPLTRILPLGFDGLRRRGRLGRLAGRQDGGADHQAGPCQRKESVGFHRRRV